jgi:hypothetical protein
MANNIGHISGYGNYGVGPYVPQRKGNDVEAEAQAQAQPQQNFEETQVDPNKVMDFLNANNFFVNLTNAPAPVEGVETDPTVADRVAGYMENFELIYGIVEQEFGPEKAPLVMDLVMDRLMGMVD